MKVEIRNINYGKGQPGWNATIKVIAENGTTISYLSWPMVRKPVGYGFLHAHFAEIMAKFYYPPAKKDFFANSEEETLFKIRACYSDQTR